jgi:hypothetical protein
MRSGFGTPTDGGNGGSVDALAQRLIATVAVMTRRAGELAMDLAEHEHRNDVTRADVNAALKYQARTFLSTCDAPEIVEDVTRTQRELFDTQSEYSSDEDEKWISDETTDSETTTATATATAVVICACERCAAVREAVETWDAWAPSDPAEEYLRGSVNRAISASSQV